MEYAGEKLKKIRLEKGISLQEVQKKTKIHPNILKAIEGDSLTDLSPVYLKGFLKIYCRFLGLDPKDYISDYKEAEQVEPLKPAKDIPAKPRPSLKSNIALNEGRGSNTFLDSAKLRLCSLRPLNKKVKTALVLIAIMIVCALGLFNLGKFISSRRKVSDKQRSSSLALARKPSRREPFQKPTLAAVTPKVNTAKPVSQQKIGAAKQLPSGIRLGVRTRENCWLSIKIDGRMVFQRVLEKGRFESWQAKDRIELSLSNAAAVEFEVNGQLFSNLGRKGQPLKNIVITKEGLNIPR